MQVLDAYQWWNKNAPDVKNIFDPPEIVLPNIAHSIWSKICPIFLLFVIDEQDSKNYWESIQTIVEMFSDEKNVPNPISHFPEFLEVLYSIRDILTPKNLNDCIYFIDKIGFNDTSHFILYQAPVFFLDPLLYFQTLIELREMGHLLWTDFVKNQQLVDAFFEIYISFLVPVPENSPQSILMHRNLLCEVFYKMIVDAFPTHNNILVIMTKLIDAIINLISLSKCSLPFDIYRTIFGLISLLEKFSSIEPILSKVISLFLTADSNNYYLTYRFLYSKKLISSTFILKSISERGIQSLTDLDILYEISDDIIVIPLILFLLKTSLHSKLWHRSCFLLIKRCILKFSASRPDVKDLVYLIIRRLFLFISFATMQKKYRNRTLMLCESLASLLDSHLPWLQQMIFSSAISLSSKPTPFYYKSFFNTNAPFDEHINHEWETFSGNIKLKTFPFDDVKGSLILTPTSAVTPVFPQTQRKSIKALQNEGKKHKTVIVKSSRSTSIYKSKNNSNSKPKFKSKPGTSMGISFNSNKKLNEKLKRVYSGGPHIIAKPKRGRPSTTQSEIRMFSKKRDAYL